MNETIAPTHMMFPSGSSIARSSRTIAVLFALAVPSAGRAQAVRPIDLSIFQVTRAQDRRACAYQDIQFGFAVTDAAALAGPSAEVQRAVVKAAQQIGEMWDSCGIVPPRLVDITAVGTHEGVVLRRLFLKRSGGVWAVAAESAAVHPRDAATPQAPADVIKALGYSRAVQLYADGNRSYYLTGFTKAGTVLLAAVHAGTATQPLVAFDLDNPGQLGFRVSAREAEYLTRNVAPNLPAELRGSTLVIAHYSAAVRVARYFSPSGELGRFVASVAVDTRGPTLRRVEVPMLVTNWTPNGSGAYAASPFLRYPVEASILPNLMQVLVNTGADWPAIIARGGIEQRTEYRELVGFTASGTTAIAATAVDAGKRYREQEAQRRQAALSGGYIYKNDAFWVSAPNEVLRDAFDGLTSPDLDSPILRISLVRYVETRSAMCPQLRKATDAVVVTTSQMIFYEGAFKVDSGPRTVVARTYVEERFKVPYGRIRNVGGLGTLSPRERALMLSQTMQGLEAMFRSPEKFLEMAAWAVGFDAEITGAIRWLFDTYGCESPIIAQLAENLHRQVFQRPTVQAERFAIAGAAAVSDPVLEFGKAETITQGCLEQGDRPFTTWTFCRCVDRVIRPIVDRSTYLQYAHDFALLRSRVANMPALSSGLYPQYEAFSGCKK